MVSPVQKPSKFNETIELIDDDLSVNFQFENSSPTVDRDITQETLASTDKEVNHGDSMIRTSKTEYVHEPIMIDIQDSYYQSDIE